MGYLQLFIKALLTTVLIECFIAAALRKYAGRPLSLNMSYRHLLVTVALASCLTLPYVWFVFPQLFPSRVIFGMVSEMFALLVEAIWYWLALRISFKKAFLLSFFTNLGSFLIGLLMIS